MHNVAATAASTAFPPLFRISVPTTEQRELSVATLPCGTSCKHKFATSNFTKDIITDFTAYSYGFLP
jgi:hypothetical protein